MKIHFALSALALAALSLSVQAATVNIDLSGATSGTFINGAGADITQRFDGQTVVGAFLSGSPTNPLTLATAGSITVAFFDPIVSAASNSVLSQPGNAAPLAILLDSDADTFSWTMGSSKFGSNLNIAFYSATGASLGATFVIMQDGYNTYTTTGIAPFRGITFTANNDPFGVRFQNMSYTTSAVPEPSTYALMGLGLMLAAGAARRRSRG